MNNYLIDQESSIVLTPATTMSIVLEAIQEIIPYELAVILSKEDNNNLKVRFSKGELDKKELKEFEIQLKNRPDLEKVLREGEVKLVKEEEHLDHLDTYEGVLSMPEGHSCMLAPLSLNGKVLGLMTLDHRQCDMFTPQRVKLTKTLSKLISLALAQTITAGKLLDEKEALIYQRNSLVSDIDSIVKGLIGKSPNWKKVIEKIKLVAPTDSPVMILGETGTGKEQVAKAIHALSSRAERPFIALNCSALNYNLAESELFGHEKGAFTGASLSRKGRFELADGGVLFLDEIGDLPLEIQPKLLRAIQEGTFERLGGEKTIHSNVRIFCATHLNLEDKVKEGKFREDLYYRLNVFPIILPALRDRKEDILLLTNYFLKNLSIKFGELKLTMEASDLLQNNIWNGNVRELQNSLERAAILSQGKVIKPEHLELQKELLQEESNCWDETIDSYDNEIKKIIIKALKKTNGKIYGEDGAAKLLDIKPTTLQSRIKKLGIK